MADFSLRRGYGNQLSIGALPLPNYTIFPARSQQKSTPEAEPSGVLQFKRQFP